MEKQEIIDKFSFKIIAQDKKGISAQYLFYFSVKTYIVGTH